MTNKLNNPPERDNFVQYADIAYQVISAQISGNYLKFIKERLIPNLGEYADFPLRELRTLMCIAHFEDEVTGAVIVKLLGYDPATVTRSTRWLIERDFIDAKANQNDARSILYALKPAGHALAARYREVSKQAIIDLNKLDPKPPSAKEIEKALKVLARIRDRSRLAAGVGAEPKRKRGK